MQKTKFEFEEKHHIIEVDGVDYEIPQRTAGLEKKIKEHDDKVSSMTEYEGNMQMLEILFGKEAAKQMCPDGPNTNLDMLARLVRVSLTLFMSEYDKMQNEDIEKKTAGLKPILEQVTDLTKAADKIQKKAK